jgi:hypothetical protein
MKKVFGYIFIVIGSILTLSLLIDIPPLVRAFRNVNRQANESAHGEAIGYAAGIVIFMGVVILIIAPFLWLGIKWTKKKPPVKEEETDSRIF